ncbi:MAG: hypothetical protein WAU78_16580 [Roseiarcus sp.]
MYIGNGMIAESVPSTKLLQTGIAASFLYRSAIGVEIQVLRPRDLDWKGYEAANYVSTAILRGGVRYGFGRLFSNIVGIRVPKKLEGAICSEFILEGLAIGSLILVTEYEEIMNSSDLFLPADFSSPEKFARIEPDYLEVVA